MRKKLIIILLTIVLFIGATVLGVTATFRVDAVTLNSSEISQPAQAEAEELLKRLETIYTGESIFNVKQSDADDVLTEFPYFRITSFKRDYPNRVVVSISEGEEVYAVERENADGDYYYFVLNGEGTVLGIRSNPNNRLDGSRNVVLKGYACSGEKGQKITGQIEVLATLEFCAEVSKKLDGIRGNVCSVELIANVPSEGVVIALQMQEGVCLYVYGVENLTAEKATKAIDAYLSLSIGDRMEGGLMIYENMDGEVVSAYRPEGALPV